MATLEKRACVDDLEAIAESLRFIRFVDIISRPKGWEPQHALDFPDPPYEIANTMKANGRGRELIEDINSRSLKDGSLMWAVPNCDTPRLTSTTEPHEDAGGVFAATNNLNGTRVATSIRASRREVDQIDRTWADDKDKLQVHRIHGVFKGKRFDAFRLDRVSDFEPTHPLEIPPFIEDYDEQYCLTDEFWTREEAIEAAAAHNAKELESGNIEAGKNVAEWHIVIEVGESIELPSLCQQSLCGTTGVSEISVYRPLRLVRPTAEEIERYAMDAVGTS